jgi:hypothetical protein
MPLDTVPSSNAYTTSLPSSLSLSNAPGRVSQLPPTLASMQVQHLVQLPMQLPMQQTSTTLTTQTQPHAIVIFFLSLKLTIGHLRAAQICQLPPIFR